MTCDYRGANCIPDTSIFTMANIGVIAAIMLGLIIVWMIVMPIYRVWSSRKRGEADLAQAQFEQRIQVAQAQGRKEAATLNMEAAVIEAEAVKKQIDIIGAELTKHDLYLRWQWIEMMRERDGETIYVATESGLPILEATRRSK